MESGSTYGWCRKRVAVGVITLAVLLAGGAGAVNQINSCTTISSQGEYVLTTNIMNSGALSCINITSSDVLFDGSGFTIDGSEMSNYGVYVHNPITTLTNVTIRNLNVTDWYSGIYYNNTSNGTIRGNNASDNVLGIVLTSSSNNTLSSNNILNNGDGIDIFSSSNYNILRGNTISNNKGGIFLRSSSNNNLGGNTISNNRGGINVFSSSNNNLSGNNVSNNDYVSIFLTSSNNNTLSSNDVSHNGDGIVLESLSTNNTIYNNLFNNTKNFRIDNSANKWNITKTKAPNSVGGSFQGGNVWSDLNGTSQTCKDGDGDGICDSSYRLDENNTDYLPLAYKPAIIVWEATQSATPVTSAEATKAPTVSATEKASGFEIVLAITTLLAVYLFGRNRK